MQDLREKNGRGEPFDRERKMNPETLPITLYQTEPPVPLQGDAARNLRYFLGYLPENPIAYNQIVLTNGNNGRAESLLLDIVIKNAQVTFPTGKLQTATGLYNIMAATFIHLPPHRAEDLFQRNSVFKGDMGRITYQLRKIEPEEPEPLWDAYHRLTAVFHEQPIEHFVRPLEQYLTKLKSEEEEQARKRKEWKQATSDNGQKPAAKDPEDARLRELLRSLTL